MTGNEGELGDEFALVDVQVSTADTARLEKNMLTLDSQGRKVGVPGHLP